ncbi:hypothetical protein FKZ69_00825 [Pseudomonas azotoformans]|nr:hypothetical protein FKZ69_00825 [Pseudomonas azotoformans]
MRWRTFPKVMGEQDVTLKFNMTALQGHRALHPAYVPGADRGHPVPERYTGSGRGADAQYAR